MIAGIPKNVAALLEALRFEDAETRGLALLDDAEWQTLLPFCDLVHLTPALATLDPGLVPEWVQRRVQDNLKDNSKRFENIRDAYQEIAEAFAHEQIEHLVIKGFSLCPDYVCSPRLRMQSDIDLYCTPESLTRARNALMRLGYQADRSLAHIPCDHLPAMVRLRDWTWRENHFDPEMPPSIELHFCLWNEPIMQFPAKGVEHFWERRERRLVEGASFVGLDRADQLGFAALHALRGLLRGDFILHNVFELAGFLHRNAGDSEFWNRWSAQHDDPLRCYQAIAFALARNWFRCRLSPAAEAQIAALPSPIRQWLQSFSGSPLHRMFRANKDHIWLRITLVRSFRAKLRILRSGLIPQRIPPLNTPTVNFTSFHTDRKFRCSQRHLNYLTFAVERLFHHAGVLLPTCEKGLRWWLLQKD